MSGSLELISWARYLLFSPFVNNMCGKQTWPYSSRRWISPAASKSVSYATSVEADHVVQVQQLWRLSYIPGIIGNKTWRAHIVLSNLTMTRASAHLSNVQPRFTLSFRFRSFQHCAFPRLSINSHFVQQDPGNSYLPALCALGWVYRMI